MHVSLVGDLRCPLCGGRFRLGEGAIREADRDEVRTGELSCSCSTYPILAGIPYLRAGSRTEALLDLLRAGAAEKALLRALGLNKAGRVRFRECARDPNRWTFRNLLALLASEGEFLYFLYRFSDPTYLCGRAVLEALGSDSRCWSGPVLDVGGGVGHFTGLLGRLAGPRQPDEVGGVVLADGDFWRVWLAKQFLAPACQPVCCTAHQPLPFAPERFSLIFCSDAFHFVRAKWLLAGEMRRLLAPDGLILLPHLHNALCANCSPGWPLPPADYRRLFAGLPVRLFKESAVLDAWCQRRPLDLSRDVADRELAEEPALLLAATRLTDLFKVYPWAPDKGRWGAWAINPLYARAPGENASVWELRFPSAEYEREFAACKRYLPERVTLSGVDLDNVRAGQLDDTLRSYAGRAVLLDLPAGYW